MDDKSIAESAVETYLEVRAKAYGGKALKLRPPTGRGFPDRTVLLPHRWSAFVEVKRPKGGRIAKHQTTWGEDLRTYGQRFYIVATFAEVDALFADYEQETGQ